MDSNVLYISCFLVYCIVRALSLVTKCRSGSNLMGKALICVVPFAFKFVSNILSKIYEVDIFDPKISSKKRYFGLVTLLSIFEDSDFKAVASDQEISLKAFYAGQLENHLDISWSVSDNPDNSSPNPFSRDNIRRLIKDHISSIQIKDIYSIKLLLMIELTKQFPNLCSYRSLMRLMKRSHRNSVVCELEQYHYRKLYENKLEALYKGKIKPKRGGGSGRFLDIYQYINQNFDTMDFGKERLVDVCSLFKDAEFHRGLAEMMEGYVQTRFDIFSKLTIDKEISSSTVLKSNTSTLRIHNEIMTIYGIMDLLNVSHSSYIYPLFIYYFSLVRNQIKKAD